MTEVAIASGRDLKLTQVFDPSTVVHSIDNHGGPHWKINLYEKCSKDTLRIYKWKTQKETKRRGAYGAIELYFRSFDRSGKDP